MKKMVVYGIDKWAKELLTLSRYEKIAYFVYDESDEDKLVFGYKKEIYKLSYLLKENRDDLIIIISNSKKYEDAAKKLEDMGFVENIHFFNGWKLDWNFYKIMDVNQDWKSDERNNISIFENEIWEKRAKIMSGMIPCDVSSVMDLGCGDCKLKKYLSQGIAYIGLDYCYRDENTIICDMNEDELPQLNVDMYYLAGVLNYINDKPRLFHQMKGKAKYILLSSYPTDQFIRLDGHIMELSSFYFQDCSIDDIVNCLYKEGFILIESKYDYKIMNVHFLLFQDIKIYCK